MDIHSITRHKPSVDDRLTAFLKNKQKSLSLINHWGGDVITRLLPFVAAGKTIRGGLLLYTYSLFEKSPPGFVLDAAAALELFQSGFLIHDDIMDQDATRRGSSAIYKQYEQAATDKRGTDVDRFGQSMGINAADLCFFLGYELLGGLPDRYMHVVQIFSREFSSVVTAQMQDVSASHVPISFGKADILSLYRYKTARYSFSLPLTVGALLANAEKGVIENMEKLGEHLGLLFQIRDDELDRSVESDRRNRKQTLASVMTKDELENFKRDLVQNSNDIMRELPIAEIHKIALAGLAVFCQNREK